MHSKYSVCFSCIIMTISGLSMARTTTSNTYEQPHNYTTTVASEIAEDTKPNATSNSSSSSSYGNFTNYFIQCPKFTLAPHEYRLLENSSIYIPKYASLKRKSIIQPRNYYIHYLSQTYPIAYICAQHVVTQEEEREKVNIGPSTYITYVCLGISLLSLTLHFVAFLMVPEMRNLPGKNLASLTVSLFLAYLLFLVGTVFDKTPVCRPLGFFIYYFMMVSFFWMNAISYDVFKSVRDATAKFRASVKSGDLRGFLWYSLYCWMLPAVFLTLVVVSEETSIFPSDFQPHFNENRCWFRQRLAVISFFAAPVAILMLANFGFFITSAVLISSNSMKPNKHKSNLKRNILLYLKLIVICGLLWIMGLVEDFVHHKALSYLILALYTLQGLYIFIAFTRFRNIIARFRGTKSDAVSKTPSVFKSTISSRNTSRGALIRETK